MPEWLINPIPKQKMKEYRERKKQRDQYIILEKKKKKKKKKYTSQIKDTRKNKSIKQELDYAKKIQIIKKIRSLGYKIEPWQVLSWMFFNEKRQLIRYEFTV